jgi:thioredoxin reductase
MDHETDVFIIGGGPAGLAAAIAASRKGFSVTVRMGQSRRLTGRAAKD